MVVCLFFCLALVDFGILMSVRRLVYSFLLSKRNVKSAQKIHADQTRRDRFTLSYIEEHAIYKKEFRFWHRSLIIFYCSVIPQYLILATVNIFSQRIFTYVATALYVVKIIIFILIRSQFKDKSITKFDKRYPK